MDLKRRVRLQVKNEKGAVLIDVREYDQEKDKFVPTETGITLSLESWRTLKASMGAIDQQIINYAI